MEVRLKEKIPGVFWPVHQAIRRGEVTEVVAKGGRGSGKSSYLSMELVWQLLRHPDCHAVVLRKVGGTLRNSVYNQIVWAIGELGCAGYFRCTVSPMECTYLPTGQKILFFGTDDPGKLKSLKLPFGAVGICWFEELDQFDGPEEVRNVEQTVLRRQLDADVKELQPAGHGPQLGQPLRAGDPPRQAGAPFDLPRSAAGHAGRAVLGRR